MFYEDGSKYEGKFLEDKREGRGLMLFNNGDYYYGEWEYDYMEGVGRMNYKLEEKTYEGNWMHGQKDG